MPCFAIVFVSLFRIRIVYLHEDYSDLKIQYSFYNIYFFTSFHIIKAYNVHTFAICCICSAFILSWCTCWTWCTIQCVLILLKCPHLTMCTFPCGLVKVRTECTCSCEKKTVISIYKHTICVESFELVVKEINHILRFIYVFCILRACGHIQFSNMSFMLIIKNGQTNTVSRIHTELLMDNFRVWIENEENCS